MIWQPYLPVPAQYNPATPAGTMNKTGDETLKNSSRGNSVGTNEDSAASETMEEEQKKQSSQIKPSNADDDDDDDDASVASSLSSIPLLEWKKQYEMTRKKHKTSTATSTSNTHAKGTTRSKKEKIIIKKKKGPTPKAVAAAVKAFHKSEQKSDSSKGARKKLQNVPVEPSPNSKSRQSVPPAAAKRSSSHNRGSLHSRSHSHLHLHSHSDEEEEAACCLCHCGVDCSDRAFFFPKDRRSKLDEQGDYYLQMEDPYLPENVYDRNNALVYCDSCNRLYHQKCHFVPLLVIPRGDWNCLLCMIRKQPQQFKNTNADKWKKFCNPSLSRQLFPSPPPATLPSRLKDLQDDFEVTTASIKAQLWSRQLHQLQTYLKSQTGNYRMATSALETLTSTKRNRAHFSGKTKSQELAQTLVRLATAKWKIRTALQSLESIRLTANALPQSLVEWTKTTLPGSQQHAARNIFPHGMELFETRARVIPRTRELILVDQAATDHNYKGNSVSSIPVEIAVPSSPTPNSSPTDSPRTQPRIDAQSPASINASKANLPRSKMKGIKALSSNDDSAANLLVAVGADSKGKAVEKKDGHNSNVDKDDDDDDSGITLDDLRCCVCFVGDATDENDVILCDGAGCCRAFHMQCVVPHVKPQDIENEDEDWFCPLCRAISHLIADVQLACKDGDWEQQPESEQELGMASLQSWESADEVFPESEWEYTTSLQLKAGKQNDETTKLVKMYLGEDFVTQTNGAPPMPAGSDSEDENDYSLFDEESFEERRRREREKLGGEDGSKDKNDGSAEGEDSSCDDDDSTRSSQATLVDMSSVELNIGKSELAALSDDGGSSSEDEPPDNGSASPQRRSRRIRNRTTNVSGQTSVAEGNGADFDESNIIEGKRKRRAVDYRKLNDALFGNLSAKDRANLDDTDDYQVVPKSKGAKKRKSKTGAAAVRKRRKRGQTQSDGAEDDAENSSNTSSSIGNQSSEKQSDADNSNDGDNN